MATYPPLAGWRRKLAAGYAARWPNLAVLVAMRRPALWQWCRRLMLTDDQVTSAGYVGVCQAAQRWRPGSARFGTYAARYIVHRVSDECRRTEEYRLGRIGKANQVLEDQPAAATEDRTELHDDLLKLKLAAGNLPAQMWQVLAWRYGFTGQKLSSLDIADALGISQDAVRVLEKKALAQCQW